MSIQEQDPTIFIRQLILLFFIHDKVMTNRRYFLTSLDIRDIAFMTVTVSNGFYVTNGWFQWCFIFRLLVKFIALIERLLNTYYTLLWIAFNQYQSKLRFHSSSCVSVNRAYLTEICSSSFRVLYRILWTQCNWLTEWLTPIIVAKLVY